MKTKQTHEENIEDVPRETEKQRQPSKLYTIRSFGQTLEKLKKMKMITADEVIQMERIFSNMLNGYLLNKNENE